MTKNEQEEFARYQRDAIRQMQEMHRQTRPGGMPPGFTGASAKPRIPEPPEVDIASKEEPPCAPPVQKRPFSVPDECPKIPEKTDFCRPAVYASGTSKADSDLMLLLGLIILLGNDRSDRTLILSLLYLLL